MDFNIFLCQFFFMIFEMARDDKSALEIDFLYKNIDFFNFNENRYLDLMVNKFSHFNYFLNRFVVQILHF